jgi:type IV secretion system protein TrbD
MGPTHTRVRQSLLRPMLVLGAERELVFGTGMIAAMLVFSFGSIVMAGAGIGFWMVALVVLQRMAKHDSMLSRVYIRHLNKKIFYPAAAHLTASEPPARKHQ